MVAGAGAAVVPSSCFALMCSSLQSGSSVNCWYLGFCKLVFGNRSGLLSLRSGVLGERGVVRVILL